MTIIKKIENRLIKYRYKFKRRKLLLFTYEKLLDLRFKNSLLIDYDYSCECILFSKDRAMQLHALLTSYYDNVKNPAPIHLIYKHTSNNHLKSYQELESIFSNRDIKFIKEKNFRNDILTIIKNMASSKIFFLADDGLFTEEFDMRDITKFNPLIGVFSMLRGLDATQLGNFVFQELPCFIEGVVKDDNKRCWKWENATNSPDWSYPLSVHGNIFSTAEMAILLDMLFFRAPNSLEGNLHKEYLYLFIKRYGICYTKTVLGHNPCNLVNAETINNLNNSGYSAKYLLKKWEDGYRIKYEDLYCKSYNEILNAKFNFTKREN